MIDMVNQAAGRALVSAARLSGNQQETGCDTPVLRLSLVSWPGIASDRGSNAMGGKREPHLEELLTDPVMVTMLRHSRITPEHVRVLLRETRERLAKARAASGLST